MAQPLIHRGITHKSGLTLLPAEKQSIPYSFRALLETQMVHHMQDINLAGYVCNVVAKLKILRFLSMRTLALVPHKNLRIVAFSESGNDESFSGPWGDCECRSTFA